MSKPSRIVVIHDSIEVRGGATALARLSAQLYKQLGFDVTYIAGGEDTGDLRKEGIDVVGIGADKLSTGSRAKGMLDGLYNDKTVSVISDWIAKNDTPETAYHLHNWAQTLSPSVFKALRPVEHRTVMSCHDLFNVCPNGGLIHFGRGTPCQLKPMSAACWASQCDRRSSVHKYWRMLRQVRLNTLAKFDTNEMTFVCLHKGMEKLMVRAGFSSPNVTSITNPATAYVETRVPAETNKKFLFVGRLNKEKGADLAVEAAIAAGVELVLIGEGELAASFADAPDNIKLAGFCSKAEISEYARQARALVVPGRWPEPYGLVIAEAALSGIPVLISEPTLLSDQVQEVGIGEVFKMSGDNDLEAALKTWAHDDDLIARLSHTAFERAHEICSTPEGWAQQFIDIMSTKIARNAHS